jgi:hypothetical protein
MGRAPVLSVVEVYAPMLALPTPNLAQPLYSVEEQLPFLVAEQLVVVAVYRLFEGEGAGVP